MAYISKEKVKQIIANAPKGSDPKMIIKGLIDRGNQLEGFTPVPAPIAPPSPAESTAGAIIGKGLDLMPGAKQLVGAGMDAARGIGEGLGQANEGISNITDALFPRPQLERETKKAITTQNGTTSYIPALDETFTVEKPSTATAEQRLRQGISGIQDVIQGGLNTAFAPAGAVVNQVPVAREVVGGGMDLLNKGSQSAADAFKSIMGIAPDSQDSKIIDQGFNILGNLLLMKVGETGSKLKAQESAIKSGTEVPKLSMGDKAMSTVLKPAMNLTGKIGQAAGDLSQGVSDIMTKRAQAKNVKTLEKAVDTYRQALKTTPKLQQYLDKRGIDVPRTLADERIPVETQKINGKVKYDTLEQAQVLKDRATAANDALKNALSSLPAKKFSLSDLYEKARTAIMKDESIFEKNKITAQNNLKDLIDLEIGRYGDAVDPVTYQNIKTKAWNEAFSKTGTITNELANDIGHIIKNDIEQAYKGNVDVKKLNKYQGDLIESAKTLEKMHGQVVANGALGKMLGGVKGLIVGASIPGVSPITALIGKYIGENITEYMANPERKTTSAARNIEKTGYVSANQKLAEKAAKMKPSSQKSIVPEKPLGGGTIPNPLDSLLEKVPGVNKVYQSMKNPELVPKPEINKVSPKTKVQPKPKITEVKPPPVKVESLPKAKGPKVKSKITSKLKKK